MRKEILYNEDLDKMLDQIKKGAFLTVSDGESVNTMTIGWGSVGVIWNRPIFMIAVRKSRHTYNVIENAKDFTISLPLNKNLKKELSYCGSYSGRDIDKIEACNLTTKNGKNVVSPIIADCELHYECKIVFKQDMNSTSLDKKIMERFYEDSDYHTLYFGEILSSYLTE